MQIFNSGFFWFFEGILFVVVIFAGRAWANGAGDVTAAANVGAAATPPTLTRACSALLRLRISCRVFSSENPLARSAIL